MVRFLFYLLLGYFILWILQTVVRILSVARSTRQRPPSNQPDKKAAEMFKDVQDAEFEELPPDEKQ